MTPLAALKPVLATALLFLAAISIAPAANVTLLGNDPGGSSSITGSTNWSNLAAPSAGNDYFTGAFTIRTTNSTTSGTSITFQGGSLSVDAGGRLLGKIGNGVANNTTSNRLTFNNLILNGGLLDEAGSPSDKSILTVAGNVTVNAASTIGANGGANGSDKFETLEIAAPISGSAALAVSGGNASGGADAGVVKLSVPNPYSGTITVSNGTSANIASIASTVNRILQLNNLNAVSNATLNLVSSLASPVSFASAVKAGPFNVGALAGGVNQTLTDTAGAAITLSVGGNNASTSYTGALIGGGNLVKVGSGTFTMTNTQTYSGTTTVNGGSLQLGNGGASGTLSTSSALTINGNLTINRNNAVVQGTDFSGGAITGTGSFTQAGSGTTTLNAANTYSGPTTVAAGKLIVSTAQSGTGAITVSNSAKLGITVSGVSQLSPGTLTLGTSGATILDFDGVNSTSVAPINAGTLAVGGQVTVNFPTGTFLPGNSYPLIHWTTSGPSNTNSFTLGSTPGLTATFSVSGSTLLLNVIDASDIWTGNNGANWDTATVNWTGHATLFANGDAVLFDDSAPGTTSVTVNAAVQPRSVLFNNNSLSYTITSSGANNLGGSGGLTKNNLASVTLSGGANTYTGVTTVNAGLLSVGALANGGSASDIGAAASGSANLVLNGGTLQYTGPTAGTDRGATLGGGVTVEITTGGNTLTNSGIIAGSGSLTKTGNGVLALSGANTFAGGVALSAGQLNLNNGGSSSANSAIGTGPLAISANTTLDNTSGSDVTLLPNNPQVWSGSFTYAGSVPNNLNLGTGAVTLTATPTVTVNAGTLTVGGAISGNFGITKLGGGTLTLSGASSYGNNGGSDTAVNGGTVAIGNDSALGTSRLNIGDGGIVQSMDSSAHTIANRLNFGSGAGGHVIFGGTGNLKLTGAANNGSDKILTVNNPQTELSGAMSGASGRTVAGTGILILSAANTYSGATTINSGATLQLGNGGTSGSLATSSVIDVEGTLIINRSNAVVQGVDFTASPITGAGGFVQAGAGTTTLNAANTYSGSSTVNNGELFITPAYQAGGAVVVADGAKFGISANSVSNSATIGSLTLGNAGATTLDFSYGQIGNPTNAALVAGAVTINGTCTIRLGGAFAVGTFPVLKYSSLSGAFAGTVVAPRGVTATLNNDTVNQLISVTVSSVGGGIVWTGTNSISPNLWDLNTTTNWLISGAPTDYIETVPPGDAVTFNDSGSGTVLLSNTASPSSVTISNTSVNYTFSGSGQINAATGLTKTGSGTVTLNLPGTYSGSTVVSNGPISIGASQTFANLSGNSAVSVSTGTPTLTVSDSADTTYSGSLGGALTLTKTGNSTLTLTGTNIFSGNALVRAGTLTLDSGVIGHQNYCSIGLSGTDNGALTLKGNAIFTNNNDFNVGDTGSSVGTVNITNNATLTANGFYVGSANATGSTASGTVNQSGGSVTELGSTAGTCAIGGRTSASGVGVYNMSGGTFTAAAGIRVGGTGTGTMNQSGGTVIALGGVDLAHTTGSAGTYNLNGGTLRATRVFSGTGANAILNFNGGVLQATNPSSPFVGSLAAAYVLAGGAIIDSAANDIVISQVLSDGGGGGGLTKLGAGTLTLTGVGSAYTGPTVVGGGTLSLSLGSVTSLNNLTVSNAALTLALNGSATSISAGNMTLTGNSTLNFNYDLISSTPVSAISASGSLAASGTTTINVFGYGWSVGQFTLVDYTGTPLANLNNFVLGALPYGVSASLSNNVANTSIDLVVTSVSAITTWIPLTATDPGGTSSFNSGGMWQGGGTPTAGDGYLTRTFALRSPADANAYTFAGSALSVDSGGRFIMKGINGQVMTVNNLIMNGGLVDYANNPDNFTETLAGNITLQGGLTSYFGALPSETLFVTAPVGGSGNLQIGGSSVNGGADVGVVVLAAANTYTGTTTVANGTLLINGANGNSAVMVNTGGTLGGSGSLGGGVTVQAGGTLAPGTPTWGALTSAIGTLTASSAASVSGAVAMKINRAASPTSDKFAAPGITVNAGAKLTVTNIGSTNLVAGDTFTLFSTPISGSFGTVTLPALPNANVYWTNKLAVNGSIAVVSSVNTSSTNITVSVSGNTMTLSWPADHLGWKLQQQTNSLSTGLGTNWVTIPGSDTMTSTNITINPAEPAVFYRMVYP